MALSYSDNYSTKCAICNDNDSSNCSACANPSEISEYNLDKAMAALVSQINIITGKVTSLQSTVNKQNKRLGHLEVNSGSDNYSESDNCSNSLQSEKLGCASRKKRLEEQRPRKSKILQDKYRSQRKRNRGEVPSDKEDQVAGKRKVLRRQEFASKQQDSDCNFSGEDSSSSNSSSSSCSDTGEVQRNVRNHRRNRRKVKSGAGIKIRPVVRTELWPHTICNEEDGGKETSDTIKLAKFLSCFTHILITCRGLEATGRAMLLHGVTTVLEYLPWREARSFHNIVMIKIEQGRIDWNTNFLNMANQFLDKKVRQTLRRSFTYDNSSSYSANFNCSRFSNDFRTQNFVDRRQEGVNNSLYSTICKHWNYGVCSFGDQCRKQHVCWSCAEAGKMGASHRAASHDNSTTIGKEDNQYF